MGFEIATGSVIGRDHTRGLRNNQDAFASRFTEEFGVVVVCDGCSSGAHSEVGAHLGAQLIAEEFFAALSIERYDVVERARQNVLAQLRVLAKAMGGSFTQVVNDYFLFTTLVAVVKPRNTYIFGIGDGVFALNGDVTVIGPFPGNAPPYLAYDLTGSSLADQRPELLRFTTHTVLPTSELDSLLIGTDGIADILRTGEQTLPGRTELVGNLNQFWVNDRYFGDNPFLVSRRLNQINPSQPITRLREDGGIERFEGLLPDDTTMAIIRRQKGA